MKKNGLLLLIGFILLAVGVLSLVLELIGMHFSFLLWLEKLGGITSFIVRLCMIVFGMLFLYFGQGNLRLE